MTTFQPGLFTGGVATGAEGRDSDQYYTPKWLFEALGCRFSIDVAAPFGGVPWVPADRFYTVADDGLAQPWDGLIWCNPPYSESGRWVERFLGHGNGVCLVPATRAYWFSDLWERRDAVIVSPVPRGSLFKFVSPDGREKGIFMPVLLVGLGPVGSAAVADSGLGFAR